MYYQNFYMKKVQHSSFKLNESHPLHDVSMFRVDREALFHISLYKCSHTINNSSHLLVISIRFGPCNPASKLRSHHVVSSMRRQTVKHREVENAS